MAKTPEKFEGFDRVFPIIGGHHLYQWLLLLIIAWQGAYMAYHHMGYIFLAAVPDHWCQIEELTRTNWTQEQIKEISIPKGSRGSFEKCEQYDLDYESLAIFRDFDEAYNSIDYSYAERKPCSKWNYDNSIYHATIATQFDLVCDRRYMVATIQASYMGGAFLSSSLGGISDQILGRRRIILLGIVTLLICSFGAAFSTTYFTFIFFRFFIAVGNSFVFQNCFTTLLEYSDTSYRGLLGTIQQIPFSIGYMILPLYAYFLRDWSDLQLSFSITMLSLISYFWILPESSRWLASNGREKEALDILVGIAKTNKKPEPDQIQLLSILEDCKSENEEEEEDSRVGSPISTKILHGLKNFLGAYFSLVKTPALRRRSFILWILSVSVTLVYYGVSFDSAALTNDPFLLVFLGGLMEIPGYFLVIPFVSKWGRRPTVITTFLLSGVCSLVVASTPFEYSVIRIIFAMSGKLFISACFAIIYLLGAELYPTAARATGLGCCLLVGRIGSMSAPYVVNQMKTVYTDLPSLIFGIVGLVAGLAAVLLPETMDVEMMESVKAIEKHSTVVPDPKIGPSIRRLSHTILPKKSQGDVSIGLNPQGEGTELNNVNSTGTV